MKIPDFSISGLPRMVFGEGSLAEVPALAASFGKQVLLVTGGASFETSAHWSRLTSALRGHGLSWQHLRVRGEPSPQLVDQAVCDHRHADIEVVLGIGGGSVLDDAEIREILEQRF